MPGIDAYSLNDDPFAQIELDPIGRPTDGRWYAPVDGFRSLDDLAGELAKERSSTQPFVAVVVGTSGTGRTSVANYLLHLWSDLIKRPLLLKRLAVNDHDSAANAQRWLQYVANLAEARGCVLADSTQRKIGDLRNRALSAATAGPELQGVLTALIRDLGEDDGPVPAVVLESARGKDLVPLVLEMCDETSCCVVLTVDRTTESEQDILSDLDRQLKPQRGRLVELSGLDGDEVWELIEHRWRINTNSPNPFDRVGVAQAFSDKSRSVGRVLAILQAMMSFKLEEYPDGVRWPDTAGLEFKPDEIQRKLERINATLKFS